MCRTLAEAHATASRPAHREPHVFRPFRKAEFRYFHGTEGAGQEYGGTPQPISGHQFPSSGCVIVPEQQLAAEPPECCVLSHLELSCPPPGWPPALWPGPRSRPAEGSLDLWLLHVPDSGLRSVLLDRSALDAAERARVAAFVYPLHRARYVAAHLALRRVLCAYEGVSPAELRFVRRSCPCCGGPHGRPALAGSGAPHFSLSHTGGLVLIGVAGRPVGVDVEALPDPDRATTVGEALHPAERRAVHAAQPALRPAVFARLWARKEAYLKGIGTGVGRSPDLDYLGDPAPGAPARPPGWTVRDIPVGPEHAAAVALERPPGPGPEPAVRMHYLGVLDGAAAESLYTLTGADPVRGSAPGRTSQPG